MTELGAFMPVPNWSRRQRSGGAGVRIGIRYKWFEGTLEVVWFKAYVQGTGLDEIIGFRFGAFFYSYRGKWIRIRHGLGIGADVTAAIRPADRHPDDEGDYTGFPFLSAHLHAIELVVPIWRLLWIELSPANFAYFLPGYYMYAGLRLEF